MDYEIRSKDGKTVISITDDEMFQIVSSVDGRRDAECGCVYPDEEDQAAQDAICVIYESLYAKLKNANLAGFPYQ